MFNPGARMSGLMMNGLLWLGPLLEKAATMGAPPTFTKCLYKTPVRRHMDTGSTPLSSGPWRHLHR
jgi:hypothetical protein